MNGSEVSRMNSRKATLSNPWTEAELAIRRGGMARENTAMAAPLMRLHRRELGRLQPPHDTGAEIAAEDLQRDADASDTQGNTQCALMKKAVPVAQEEEAMHGGNGKTCCHKGRQRHVEDFMEAGRVQHGHDRVNIGNPALRHLEACRRVHPRIGGHDKNSGEDPADSDDQSRKPVQERREAVPAV